MKKMQLTLSVLVLVLGFVSLPTKTEAHRSGCHRWHSCPSDTGSYVCGDLGYTSGCPSTAAPQPVHVPVTTSKVIDNTEAIAPETTYKKTWREYEGFTKLADAGATGEKKISTKITYVDNVQTASEIVGSTIVTEPKAAVQIVGKRIKPLATITAIQKEKGKDKYTVLGMYQPNKEVTIAIKGKKTKHVKTDAQGKFVFHDVKLKASDDIKIYKREKGKEQQISEKTLVDLKKLTLTTEYQKLHGQK